MAQILTVDGYLLLRDRLVIRHAELSLFMQGDSRIELLRNGHNYKEIGEVGRDSPESITALTS